MTILIGVLCKDGVVIGADSIATVSMGSMKIMELGPVNKIEIIEGKCISATTGSVGLAQRFNNILNEKVVGAPPVSQAIKHVTEISNLAIKNFAQTPPFNRNPDIGWGFGALYAFVSDNEYHLVEFDQINFHPEFKKDLPIVSMGCGQYIADPFLGFIWKIFLKEREITLYEGVMIAYWALKHTIAFNPGGIGGNQNIAILTKDEKKISHAQLLNHDDLQEHLNLVDEIEKRISNIPEGLFITKGKIENIPKVPNK